MYKGIDVNKYESQFNTLVRRREEFECHKDDKFRMFQMISE